MLAPADSPPPPSFAVVLARPLQFKTNAPSVSGSDATGLKVAVTSVDKIEGDVTVGQRKSKCEPFPALLHLRPELGLTPSPCSSGSSPSTTST